MLHTDNRAIHFTVRFAAAATVRPFFADLVRMGQNRGAFPVVPRDPKGPDTEPGESAVSLLLVA
ncbi:MAG: hypothetical protein V3V08_02950 [Nannocystaceae bacterium]